VTIPSTIVRYVLEGGTGTIDQLPFYGSDTLWGEGGEIPVGQGRAGMISCSGTVHYRVEVFATPSAPTMFAGALTPCTPASEETCQEMMNHPYVGVRVGYVIPTYGAYGLHIGLSQGAIEVTPDSYREGGPPKTFTFASPGALDQIRQPGATGLYIKALEGPQADWSVSVVNETPDKASALLGRACFPDSGECALDSPYINGTHTNSASGRRRPTTVHLAACVAYSHLKWHGWGTGRATGVGRLSFYGPPCNSHSRIMSTTRKYFPRSPLILTGLKLGFCGESFSWFYTRATHDGESVSVPERC
jgi:hypothetical protein